MSAYKNKKQQQQINSYQSNHYLSWFFFVHKKIQAHSSMQPLPARFLAVKLARVAVSKTSRTLSCRDQYEWLSVAHTHTHTHTHTTQHAHTFLSLSFSIAYPSLGTALNVRMSHDLHCNSLAFLFAHGLLTHFLQGRNCIGVVSHVPLAAHKNKGNVGAKVSHLRNPLQPPEENNNVRNCCIKKIIQKQTKG